jgi:hypothetical protein
MAKSDADKARGQAGVEAGEEVPGGRDHSARASDLPLLPSTRFVREDAKSGANVGVAKLVGNGRVLAWADEWVTYTSQWGLTPDPKYDDPVVYAQCVGHTPRTSYVVPQFWNNVFKWSVPGAACFVIEPPPDSGQIVIP